jgi:hypothetical protein
MAAIRVEAFRLRDTSHIRFDGQTVYLTELPLVHNPDATDESEKGLPGFVTLRGYFIDSSKKKQDFVRLVSVTRKIRVLNWKD